VFSATGDLGHGTVFRLLPDTGNGWKETPIYLFGGSQLGDGAQPAAGLAFGKDGALYGTTYEGGAHGHGTVFSLMPPAVTKLNGQRLCSIVLAAKTALTRWLACLPTGRAGFTAPRPMVGLGAGMLQVAAVGQSSCWSRWTLGHCLLSIVLAF
jgi:uncharacterized repeat protein (TIGR03803 family)